MCPQRLQFCCDFKTQQKEIAAEKSNKPQIYLNTASKKVQSITNKKENPIIKLGAVPSGHDITSHQQMEDKTTQEEENASSLQKAEGSELHARTAWKNNKKETQDTGFTQAKQFPENNVPKNYVSGLNYEAEKSKLHNIEENDGSENISEEEPNKLSQYSKSIITTRNSENNERLMNVSHKEQSHVIKNTSATKSQEVKGKQPMSLLINTRQVVSHNGAHPVGKIKPIRNDPDYSKNLHTYRKCDPEDFSCVNGNKQTYTVEPAKLYNLSARETELNSTEERDTSINYVLISITSQGESEPISLHTDPIILGSRYQPIDMSFTNSHNNSPSRAFKTIRELTKKGLSFTIFYWIYVAAFLYVACYLLGFIIMPFSVLGFIIKIIIVQFLPAIVSLHFFHAADIILEFIYDQVS